MVDDDQLEESVLAREYKWLLGSESHRTYQELVSVLHVAMDLLLPNSKSKEERFIMNGKNGTRCIFCLEGYLITEADIMIKDLRAGNQLTLHRTSIRSDLPWKLSQMQEAINHLNEALQLAETALELPNHATAHQLVNELDDLIRFLRKSKDALIVSSKSSLFTNSINTKNAGFSPPLPTDLDMTFSIQSPKVLCSVYQMLTNQKGKPVFDNKLSMETIVPRLNDVMIVINRSFNLCQMLKDKFAFFLKLHPDLLSMTADEMNYDDNDMHVDDIISRSGLTTGVKEIILKLTI